MKNKKWRIFCLLLSFCIFMTSGCNFGSTTQNPSVQEEKSDDGQTTEIIVPGGKEDTPEEDEDKTKEEEKEESKKTQNKPFWQSETSMHYENLAAVAAAAQQDYRINGAKRGWMSKNGKLYGYYDGCYITPAMLVKEGYLESGLNTTGYEILMINGSDLAKYDGANVPSGSNGFGVFAAVKQNNKYLLASPNGKAGQISSADYTALLAKYNQSHGTVGRLSSASAEYGRILNYICLYEGKFEDFFVREIRKDNKYAVVTFSTTANTANIKQYLLRNDNGFWEVVYPNIQMDAYPINAINKLVPDFNVEVLPKYNLAAWKTLVKAEQGGAVAALFSNYLISTKAEIDYQCETSNCAYFRLTDGSRCVAYSNGEYWTAARVNSDIAAKNYFMERTGVDYSFIILDD
ncbi:MAG: hypothetical protein IJY52_04915 [Anaerotignum sp.]|nr:hypothetical protein [Anaerotignum sp.]